MSQLVVFDHLVERSFNVRRNILRLTGRGGCFAGAALSCVDLLVFLYGRVARVSPTKLDDPNRDYVLLSKGHAVPALYGTLIEYGFFDVQRLSHHLDTNDVVYWHPNAELPGVEFHSGSLGHLLSVGLGIAYDARLRGSPSRVFVVVGDGEMNEGSIWEGLLVANALRLSNLVLLIDRNRLQANVATETLVPLEPLGKKLSAFGFRTLEADGHDFGSLAEAFEQLDRSDSRPLAMIFETVRGKGIPSLEGRNDAWFLNVSAEAASDLERELVAARQAKDSNSALEQRGVT